ncbi:UNVERIFIED_CONTAM: Dync1li2 [Trichonephila clavipes]
MTDSKREKPYRGEINDLYESVMNLFGISEYKWSKRIPRIIPEILVPSASFCAVGFWFSKSHYLSPIALDHLLCGSLTKIQPIIILIILLTGDNESGKTSLIAKLEGNEDPRKGSGLEYHYIFVRDEYRDDHTRLGVYVLDGDQWHRNLLKYVLNEETFSNTTVLLTASMSEPWDIMESLKNWAQILEEHVQRLRLPESVLEEHQKRVLKKFEDYVEPGAEPDGVTTPVRPVSISDSLSSDREIQMNLGLEIIVVITKTDFMSTLEKQHDFKEEHFDFIQITPALVVEKDAQETPIRTAPGVQKSADRRLSGSPGVNASPKKIESKHGTVGGEGVLQNFFNSLLNRRTGSPIGGPSVRGLDKTTARLDAAVELDRMAGNKKPVGFSPSPDPPFGDESEDTAPKNDILKISNSFLQADTPTVSYFHIPWPFWKFLLNKLYNQKIKFVLKSLIFLIKIIISFRSCVLKIILCSVYKSSIFFLNFVMLLILP